MSNKIVVSLTTNKECSYSIFINTNILYKSATWLSKNLNNNLFVIITDNNVRKLYGNHLVDFLKKKGKKVLLISFIPGEKSKNYKTKQYIENLMLDYHCGRDTIILALGGGVVGDLAGFVAATYMRGVPYIQIPTTLLAMVDSSIGGKTGIDTLKGKNLIGAFWQPKAVITDIHCLITLPKKQLINGFIEVLKIFLISDKKYFEYVQDNFKKFFIRDPKVLKHIIFQSIKLKAHIVKQDMRENNQRIILNFGHTIGHALECASGYKMMHGYAVAYGILVESKISHLLGILDIQCYQAIRFILSQLGIIGKTLQIFDIDKIIQATRLDKKAEKGNTRYVLLKKLGQVHMVNDSFAHVVPDEIVRKAFFDVRGMVDDR